MPFYDRFLKPDRPGPPAQLWLLIGFLLIAFVPASRWTYRLAPGGMAILRNGKFQGLARDVTIIPPHDELWRLGVHFVHHAVTGGSEFLLVPSATRTDAAGNPLPTPTPEQTWAAIDAWLLADGEFARLLPPDFLRLCAAHATSDKTTGWRYYTFPLLRILGYTLLLAGSAVAALGLAREIRISREDTRHRRGHCPDCGYDRTSLPSYLPCPECGSKVPPRLPPFSWLKRPG